MDMDKETKQPEADLLQSVKDMKQNTIKTRSGRTLIMPTPEEDAAINRGIAEDPDTYELSAEEMKQLRPFGEVMAERQAKRIDQPPSDDPKR